MRTKEKHPFAPMSAQDRVLGAQDQASAGRAGTGRQTRRNLDGIPRALPVENRRQHMAQGIRGNAQQGFFLADELLLDHVHGDLDRRQPRPFAVAGLQDVETVVLADGEFQILHVPKCLSRSSRTFKSC